MAWSLNCENPAGGGEQRNWGKASNDDEYEEDEEVVVSIALWPNEEEIWEEMWNVAAISNKNTFFSSSSSFVFVDYYYI